MSGRQYLEGIYAPVEKEVEARDLVVHGEIPRDLRGTFVQNGSSPRFEPGTGHSWFDGDGMVHGVEIADDGVSFRSRWVQTQGLADDVEAGHATHIGSLAKPGVEGRRHKNVANTDLVFHGGRLLALWWEGGEPYELDLPDLSTKGTFDYGGTLDLGMTSHAKLDPQTGELFFFSWGPKPPFLHVGVASDMGEITKRIPVPLEGPRVQHDMAISDRWIVVFDFPMELDFAREGTDLGFVLRDDRPARIGLVSRADSSQPTQWFEVAPCFMWHLACAWDEGDELVLVGARIEGATRVDRKGKIHDDLPLVDGEHRFDSHPYRWRLNTRTGAVSEGAIDDRFVEFPRVSDERICAGARYAYMAEVDTSAPTLKAKGLFKYDLSNDKREGLAFPAGHFGYEASFAPRIGSSVEDDGYVVGYVTNEDEGTSELWITAAQALADGPVARIELPQRVPAKFHGRWIPTR